MEAVFFLFGMDSVSTVIPRLVVNLVTESGSVDNSERNSGSLLVKF